MSCPYRCLGIIVADISLFGSWKEIFLYKKEIQNHHYLKYWHSPLLKPPPKKPRLQAMHQAYMALCLISGRSGRSVVKEWEGLRHSVSYGLTQIILCFRLTKVPGGLVFAYSGGHSEQTLQLTGHTCAMLIEFLLGFAPWIYPHQFNATFLLTGMMWGYMYWCVSYKSYKCDKEQTNAESLEHKVKIK